VELVIFWMRQPFEGTYAQADSHGSAEATFCPACDGPTVRWLQPLEIEWQAGSDVIGDFVWPGKRVVARQPIVEELARRFRGIEPGPVQMWQKPKLKRPTRVTKRTKPRMWLPYEGPPLAECWVTAFVPADEARSTLSDHGRCETCGLPHSYWVQGIELKPGDLILEGPGVASRITRTHVPRRPGAGLLFHAEDLTGVDIFKEEEGAGWLLCTEPVKRFIQERGYTNIDFWEVGETFESSA
jgi:hypothetical protein